MQPPGNQQLGQLAVIGLGVMGQNLALNVVDHGFTVAVWNHTPEKMKQFVAAQAGQGRGQGSKLIPALTLRELVASLERPRRILLLVKAGSPVDEVIAQLRDLVEPGDIVIDGGNSWFKDTQRREAELSPRGFHFVGMGVSGGEDGARFGPSLMPGGTVHAWESLRPILEAIAARTESGPCVTHVGPDGAGHFVKMVHNGIEYADMQLIAEGYDLLRRAGFRAGDLAPVFARWNEGPLGSFLIEITARIFTVEDPETGRPLVDLVLDRAGQKGTGKWTAQIALDLAVPIPAIAAALDARVMSSEKEARVAASAVLRGPDDGIDDRGAARSAPATLDPRSPEAAMLASDVHDALLAAKICAYAQGMRLIAAASGELHWSIEMREMARIWKGGCIIRAKLLDAIMRAYERDPRLPNLLLDGDLGATVQAAQAPFRRVVARAAERGVPVPAMAASLSYFDMLRAAELPQNLTQAQRDAFGAHTYERRDHLERGFVHSAWLR